MPLKKYRPQNFVPTTSISGSESPYIFRGENCWIRLSRDPNNVYAEGYTGSQDLGEAVATKTLTGTLAWSTSSLICTGTAALFLTELHLGQVVMGDGGVGLTEVFVVEKITDNTHFTFSKLPLTTASAKTGYVLGVIQAVGTDRATFTRGSVVRFPKGHLLGVGDGEVKINGASLSATFNLSRTPRFALYNPATNTYTQDTVGIAKPTVPITLAALTVTVLAAPTLNISASTNASPIVITTGAVANGVYTGETVYISGHLVNTNANGTWVATKLTATTFSLNGSTGNGVGGATGTVASEPSQMQAGTYNIRICAKNTQTLGFSQPSEVTIPITLTAGQSIQITFNSAMVTDQDAYDIYGTQFEDNSTTTIQAAYMGPWYLVQTVTASMLQDVAHPTGRETGTSFVFSYADAEIVNSTQILTFDNFAPVDAEYVDIINGIPMYFSSLGQGNTGATTGTSPGPSAVPSKPSNPEAIFLNKALTMAGGDYIIGEFNAKARIYALGQNTLQNVVLTTLDDEPITFRSLWTCGFRNPYNATFVKEYIYAFSTQQIVRGVAGGDDSTIEFEFTADVRDYVKAWPTGHIFAGYDPKNRAVCFFYSAAEKRNQSGTNYWVTIVLPFLLDKQVWNPPIILKKTNADFIVSGVATVGNQLTFVAGGKNSGGTVATGTYVFDGGDTDQKDWYIAWNYADDEFDLDPKSLRKQATTGTFQNGATLQLFGFPVSGALTITDLETGSNAVGSVSIPSSASLTRNPPSVLDATGLAMYALRLSGSYTTVPMRLDELIVQLEGGNATT